MAHPHTWVRRASLLFGNSSAQGAVPQVGRKGKRKKSPWMQLLLGCRAHVGVSTVAVPSGDSRSCGWPEGLLAGKKKRATLTVAKGRDHELGRFYPFRCGPRKMEGEAPLYFMSLLCLKI